MVARPDLDSRPATDRLDPKPSADGGSAAGADGFAEAGADGVARPVAEPTWPTSRPSLAYQWALDVAACHAVGTGLPITLVAGHPGLGRELAHRLRLGADRSVPLADRPAPAGPDRHSPSDSDPGTVVWLEPTRRDWESVLGRAQALAAGDGVRGSLIVVAASPRLARGLPEWTVAGAPLLRHGVGATGVLRRLNRAGWFVEDVVGFRGPRALALGVAERLAARAGRPALADRLGFRMRMQMVERGIAATLCTVIVAVARPPHAAAPSRRGR